MVSSSKAAVITGNEMIINTLEVSDAQVKMGIFIRFIPGARIFMMVTKKLMPARVVPIPAI